MSKTTMTQSEREAFLAETRVGVFSVTEPGRGPLSIPVWFHYEPGGVVRFTTGGGSKKARLMRASGRASFLVQTETAPYKYASIEGPARIAGPAHAEQGIEATIEQIRTTLNPRLAIQGVVMTMFDKRNTLSEQVLNDVRGTMGSLVYDTVIPRNVRLSEAPSYGKPVLVYDLKCVGSEAYLRLATEIIQREKALKAG